MQTSRWVYHVQFTVSSTSECPLPPFNHSRGWGSNGGMPKRENPREKKKVRGSWYQDPLRTSSLGLLGQRWLRFASKQLVYTELLNVELWLETGTFSLMKFYPTEWPRRFLGFFIKQHRRLGLSTFRSFDSLNSFLPANFAVCFIEVCIKGFAVRVRLKIIFIPPFAEIIIFPTSRDLIR